MAEWQLQTAKAKFSELVTRTLEDGPQVVTRHGAPVVVVLSISEFDALKGAKASFKAALRGAHLGDLELTRDRSVEPGGERSVTL